MYNHSSVAKSENENNDASAEETHTYGKHEVSTLPEDALDKLTALLFSSFDSFDCRRIGANVHFSIRYPHLHSWLPGSLDQTARCIVQQASDDTKPSNTQANQPGMRSGALFRPLCGV